MVSIKEATANAMKFAREALGEQRTAGLRLEEVDSTTGTDHWLITLSMASPFDPDEGNLMSQMAVLLKEQREYKVFTVRKSDGEVTAMKIRELGDR